jgi:hypothetical protein
MRSHAGVLGAALFWGSDSVEISAGLGVFIPLGVSVSAENFTAAHVIVPVSAAVRIVSERGVFGLVHELPPAIGVSNL